MAKLEIKYDLLTEYLKTLCYEDFEDDTRKSHIQKAYTNRELKFGMNPEKIKKQKFIAYGEPYLIDVIGCDLSVVWSTKKFHKLKTSCGVRSLGLKFDRTLLKDFGFVVNGYWAIPEQFLFLSGINGKIERCKKANELLLCISHCGRKFFNSEGLTSFLRVSSSGRVFFNDSCSAASVYTHYNGYWRGFSNGGSLRALIESLRDYIMRDKKLNAQWYQPVLTNGFDHIWGYAEDIIKVQDKIIELGMDKK